jgi:O-antigen ligase
MARSGWVVHGPRRAAHLVSGQSEPVAAASAEVRATNAEGIAAAFLMLLALVFGGGTRNYLFTDLAVQFAAIPVLVFALSRQGSVLAHAYMRDWLLLIGVILSLPVLFLLPFPSFVWAWLPGRNAIAAMQTAHSLADSMFKPLSLDPTATWAVLRALLPALALALLVPQLDHAWRRRLLYLVILAGVFTVPLALAQMNGGPHSELRFYFPTNPQDAVGLFANRNHFAALLVSGLALVGVFLVEDLARPAVRADFGRLKLATWILLAGVLIFGLALSRSRAGVGLALLAMAVCAWMAWRQLGRRALPWIAVGGTVALLLGFHVGFVWIADRAQQFFVGDQRWQILGASMSLAREFGWLGVGPGAFPAAYAAYEPIAVLGPRIINHAHNDWLEWWIELGLLLPLIALVFGRWLLGRVRALVASQDAGGLHLYQHGPLLVVVLAIIHAAFDYQLRTTTDLCVFVLCCACLVPNRQQALTRPSRPNPRLASVRSEDVPDEQPG